MTIYSKSLKHDDDDFQIKCLHALKLTLNKGEAFAKLALEHANEKDRLEKNLFFQMSKRDKCAEEKNFRALDYNIVDLSHDPQKQIT